MLKDGIIKPDIVNNPAHDILLQLLYRAQENTEYNRLILLSPHVAIKNLPLNGLINDALLLRRTDKKNEALQLLRNTNALLK